jgi:hypothetical protein
MAWRRIFYAHWMLTFLLLFISAAIFGVCSYNIFHLLIANLDYIAQYGWLGLMDGGLVQLLELLGYGIISAVAYLVVKACEKVLVEKLTAKD